VREDGPNCGPACRQKRVTSRQKAVYLSQSPIILAPILLLSRGIVELPDLVIDLDLAGFLVETGAARRKVKVLGAGDNADSASKESRLHLLAGPGSLDCDVRHLAVVAKDVPQHLVETVLTDEIGFALGDGACLQSVNDLKVPYVFVECLAPADVKTPVVFLLAGSAGHLEPSLVHRAEMDAVWAQGGLVVAVGHVFYSLTRL
jgi:hypothetical protein